MLHGRNLHKSDLQHHSGQQCTCGTEVYWPGGSLCVDCLPAVDPVWLSTLSVAWHFANLCFRSTLSVCVCVSLCVLIQMVVRVRVECVWIMCQAAPPLNWPNSELKPCRPTASPQPRGMDFNISAHTCPERALSEPLRWPLTQNTIITRLNWSHWWYWATRIWQATD